MPAPTVRWRHYSVTSGNSPDPALAWSKGHLTVQFYTNPGEKIRMWGYFLQFLAGNESSTTESMTYAEVALPVLGTSFATQGDGSEVVEALLKTAAGAQFRAHVWAVIEPS